jgi:asparagine synthase (glutamine-hydrolysing)
MLRQALRGGPFRDYLDAIQHFGDEARRALWHGQLPGDSAFAARYAGNRWGAVKRINEFDLDMYLPGQLLAKADRAGMMNSLEVRSPLLDHRLAEFVVNLPLRYKVADKRGKVVLKDLLAEVMPAEFVHRKKQGFGAPVRDWLKTICRPLVRDSLSTPNARIYAFLDRAPVMRMLDRFYATDDASDYIRIWILLCLELWLGSRRRVAGTAHVEAVPQMSGIA